MSVIVEIYNQYGFRLIKCHSTTVAARFCALVRKTKYNGHLGAIIAVDELTQKQTRALRSAKILTMRQVNALSPSNVLSHTKRYSFILE